MEDSILEKFSFVVETVPGFNVIKDCSSYIMKVNNSFAKMMGWKFSEAAVGKNDYDIPCKASEFAHEFIKIDRQVMDLKLPSLTVDIIQYHMGRKIFLSEKTPILNEKNISIGVYAHSIDVTNIDYFKIFVRINKLDGGRFGENSIQSVYSLSENPNTLKLTEKQKNCLFLFIRGKTSKEIAKILKISYRTVECHLEAIKAKLHCKYKSEVIEKSLDSGFLFYIPKYFQSEKLEFI